MKLITFLYNSKELVGVMTSDGQRAVPCSELGVNYADMETLASHITDEELAAMKQKLEVPEPASDMGLCNTPQ